MKQRELATIRTRYPGGMVGLALVLILTVGTPLASWAEGDQQPAPSRGAADVSPDVARQAASIARQTMSPFCPGRTLSDCPSPNATEWRRDIRAMVAKGMSAAEIQAELERRAGGNLSGIPNRESSYGVPIALATGAALLLYFLFLRLRRPEEEGKDAKPTDKEKGASQEEAPSVDDDRLQAELDSED